MSPTQRHRWLTLPDTRERQRAAALRRFALDQARADFERPVPAGCSSARWWRSSPPIEEEANIGDVLKAMPTLVGDLEVTTLVVVDGGTDGTAGVALDAGVYTCVLPVNLGQGAALRLGYELAAAHGARYVVTLDADGQNDPAEIGDHARSPCSTTPPTSSSPRAGWGSTRPPTGSAGPGSGSTPGSSTPSGASG